MLTFANLRFTFVSSSSSLPSCRWTWERHWGGDHSRGGARSPPRPPGTGSPTGRGWPGCSAPPAPGPGAACWTQSPGGHIRHHITSSKRSNYRSMKIEDISEVTIWWSRCGGWAVTGVWLYSTLTQSPLRPRVYTWAATEPCWPRSSGNQPHRNNEYYCRLMHFYHYLWQCTEHVSYFESYHRIV